MWLPLVLLACPFFLNEYVHKFTPCCSVFSFFPRRRCGLVKHVRTIDHNPSGRALALTLACYAPCDRAPPEMHPLKMFEILGHPHFKQLHGHKIPMNATNSPDRLNLCIFSLSLSYHSFVSVHEIQQKPLLNKINVYAFIHRGGQHHVANATLFVTCTRDGCATFRSTMTSSEVTWITWSPLWCSTHLPNSEIFIARNNAFFIATMHVVKDIVVKILG